MDSDSEPDNFLKKKELFNFVDFEHKKKFNNYLNSLYRFEEFANAFYAFYNSIRKTFIQTTQDQIEYYSDYKTFLQKMFELSNYINEDPSLNTQIEFVAKKLNPAIEDGELKQIQTLGDKDSVIEYFIRSL